MLTIKERNSGATSLSAKWLVICIVAILGTVLTGLGEAGITGFGISSGRITRFGSIFVNNREFDISNAAIVLDGQPGSEADLKLGQTVFVRGLLDGTDPVGEASEVIFGDNVEGPISGIDDDEESLTVLGLGILTDVQTVYALQSGDDSFEDLDLNEQIEVSGFMTADGEVLASRIEQKAVGGQNEVIGTVHNLTGSTFTFNGLTVDFSSADLINFGTGAIAEGDIAEVKGTDFGMNGELIAKQVELQEEISGEFGDLGEFEGLIVDFDSASSFSVGGISVSTNSLTTFIGGGPGNLTENVSVEVAGEFDADGVLAAGKVTIRGTRIRIHAETDSVHSNSITALGITATVSSATQWRDKGPIGADPFNLTYVSAGDYVEIKSFENPDATTPFLAERVNRVDPEKDIRLQGFVDYINGHEFQIHGVTIVVRDTDYSDANDKKISSTQFFNRLTIGTFVKVIGSERSSLLVDAAEVGLQLSD